MLENEIEPLEIVIPGPLDTYRAPARAVFAFRHARDGTLEPMQSKATTVAQYLKELDPERRKAISEIRKVVRANLDPKIKEQMTYGMIGYVVPLSVYPDGYHCQPDTPLPFANIASQKNHMALYLFCIYADEEEQNWLVKNWKATGKKLDMGKSCIRFKKLEDVPLDVIGESVRRITAAKFIEAYESARSGAAGGKKKPAARKKSAKKKASKKKPAAKKAAARKATKKKTTKKASRKKSA